MDTRVKAIEFDEEKHEYWYLGKRLNGITGVIGKMLNKTYSENSMNVQIGRLYGDTVHKEIENYFNNHDHWFNDSELSTEGAKWIINELKAFCDSLILDRADKIECEVMVSDFEGTASKIDVVVRTDVGSYIFDVKTTSHFDRAYCSLQLSVYKKLYEQNYDEHVLGMYVLGTKSKRAFRIIQQEDSRVNKILNMNKGV